MERKQEKRSVTALVGDALLTVLSVSILGLTFYGLSALTPKSAVQIAQNNSNVLGAKSDNVGTLTYFPQSLAKVPYITASSFAGTTDFSGQATADIQFSTLEPSTYEFTVTTIKNTSLTDKKVMLTPTYSIEGSYTKISVLYEGQKMEIISAEGVISPVEMVVSANSIVPVTIILEPTTKLQVQPTLTLVFTEKP